MKSTTVNAVTESWVLWERLSRAGLWIKAIGISLLFTAGAYAILAVSKVGEAIATRNSVIETF